MKLFPISKTRYLQGFCIVVILLAIYRCNTERHTVQPSVKDTIPTLIDSTEASVADTDTLPVVAEATPSLPSSPSIFFTTDGQEVRHRILSVSSYAKEFPDTNDLQMKAAHRWGISPVQNREEAEKKKSALVYVGSNPYYQIDRLQRSIPYLVPRAAVLLQQIGQAFSDSLYIKGVPLHRMIVTSVMRTKDDVQRLRRYNHNATENSCHMYGTTFDISYNRYSTVQTKEEPRRQVRNDSLKFILSEVLRDQRNLGKCYIKYERKQGCFHITVR